jgi:hypothetical protein
MRVVEANGRITLMNEDGYMWTDPSIKWSPISSNRMVDCLMCGMPIDRPRDFYITINERKAASVDVCSLNCAKAYVEDRA